MPDAHFKLGISTFYEMYVYVCETWTIYSKQEKRLNSFHLRCLRKIVGIKWQDKMPDTEVLQKAGVSSLMAVLRSRRMRWLGHVNRMDDSRIPKQVLYGELSEGSRARGRPKLRFKDQCKTTLKELSIDENEWEVMAKEREEWRYVVHSGTWNYEAARIEHAKESRQRRKVRQRTEFSSPSSFNCAH